MRHRLPALSSPSFALISVLALVSLAALTATAFLASARLDRQANRSLGESARLEMACASAMNCAKFTLNQFCEDSWTPVATYWRGTNDTDWTNEIGYLLFGVPGSNSVRWFYFPGFNPAIHKKLDTNVFVIKGTNSKPGSYLTQIGSYMATMTNNFVTNPALTNTNCTLIPLLGGRTSPPVGWTYIYQDKKIANSTNTTNVPVARFSYYMEDLSGLIDAERMGGSNRNTGTNASEISLTNLTTNWSSTSIINAGNYNQFINPTNRAKYFSPGLMLYANSNITTNDLRYFAHGLLSWNAFPNVIPVGIPISKTLVYAQGGSLKMNLNSLGTSASGSVDNIAQMITTNLSTDFLERAGGLTNAAGYAYTFDYAKCLAANIVDYIDTDSTPTYGSNGTTKYCGIELAPVVTCVALANARGNCTYPGVANTATTPPPQYIVTETITATLSLQFWNPYNKATPATNVPLEFRTCPPGSETNNGLAYVIPGNSNTPIAGNGSYQHFETLFPNFKSNNINIPAIPPNSYELVEVAYTNSYTWTNLSGSSNPNRDAWGMKRASSGPGSATVIGNMWRPVYITHTPNNDGIKLTRGDAAASTAPWNWNYNDHYSSGDDGRPLTNNCWQGYLKIGLGGSLCTMTNLYINSGDLDEDNANRSCWYPNLRLFAGTIGNGTLSDSTNCVGTGDPRISYFARPTNDQPLYSSSSWNRGGTTASQLSWGGRAIVRASVGSDAVRSNRITEKSSAFRDASLATDPTTWLDSGHADNPFGTNCPYTSGQAEDKPSAPTYASAANLFSKIPSSQWKTNQAPCHIANSPLTNICELGNIFDPIMWTRESQDIIGLKNSSNKPSVQHGGGNTLRIGRAEHPRFAFTDLGGTYPVPNMGLSAIALLDLFSVSNSYDNGGKINLNTAPAPVLRALAGGVTLTNDPSMKPSTNLAVTNKMTEAFVQGVMRYRATYPFLSPSQLAFIATDYGNTNGSAHWTNTWPANAVFGNTNSAILMTNAPGYSSGSPASLGVTQWNDQAAEELFSKIYSLTSVGSCNYRTYVVAQLVDTNGLPIGRTMRKYSLMHIRYGSASSPPTIDAGPFISFESPY